MISATGAHKILEKIWEELKYKDRFACLSENWKENFPNEPGVYVVWEKGEENPVYVGETGNIRERMGDFKNTLNHTLRRTVGRENFKHAEGFEAATSKKKFPEHIEKLVDDYFRENLTVSCLPTYLGRKEFEEYIIDKFNLKYKREEKRRKRARIPES